MKRALTVLAWMIALSLATVTAVANFRFGFLMTAGWERWVYAVGGTLLDVAKTFLPTLLAVFLVGRLTPGTFFKHIAGWLFWSVGVVWSITCALGLYAIARDAHVGDLTEHQATYRQLMVEKPKKEARIAELAASRAFEIIEGDLAAQKRDRLWDRTLQCAEATAPASRSYCASIEKLTASLATAPKAADLAAETVTVKRELREIEVKLAGMNLEKVFQAADPATDALAKITGWDAETVRVRMALILAILFEGGGLLGWITTGSHAPVREPNPAKPHKAEATPTVPALKPAPAQGDSVVAKWAAQSIVRRKGSFVPASDTRADFEAWCRLNGHEVLKQTPFGREMTRLGFERKKVGGNQRYVDIALARQASSIRLVSSN